MNGVGVLSVASVSSTGNGFFNVIRKFLSSVASIVCTAARKDWP